MLGDGVQKRKMRGGRPRDNIHQGPKKELADSAALFEVKDTGETDEERDRDAEYRYPIWAQILKSSNSAISLRQQQKLLADSLDNDRLAQHGQ